MAINIQGCIQGDRPNRSPSLSNQHMSFSWLLGRLVLWRPSLHNIQCGTPIHVGFGPWVRDMGTWHHYFSNMPTHLFSKHEPCLVYGTSPLVMYIAITLGMNSFGRIKWWFRLCRTNCCSNENGGWEVSRDWSHAGHCLNCRKVNEDSFKLANFVELQSVVASVR